MENMITPEVIASLHHVPGENIIMSTLIDIVYNNYLTPDTIVIIIEILLCTVLGVFWYSLWISLARQSLSTTLPESRTQEILSVLRAGVVTGFLSTALVHAFLRIRPWWGYILCVMAISKSVDNLPRLDITGILKSAINIFVSITKREKIKDHEISPHVGEPKNERTKKNR